MACLVHAPSGDPNGVYDMPSRNVGAKRQDTGAGEAPAELARREAQDRARSRTGSGRARSPVDSMHVDAPKQRDNEAGHRRKKRD